MSNKPLTVSRVGHVLTLTGAFSMREVNGCRRWVLSILGVSKEPSIELDVLTGPPSYDSQVTIAVFDFKKLKYAKAALKQLVDAGYAYDATNYTLTSNLDSAKQTINWDSLTESVNGIKKPEHLYELTYPGALHVKHGRAKYGDEIDHKDFSRPAGKCKECGGSGFYQGFNVKREPCSEGCKAP